MIIFRGKVDPKINKLQMKRTMRHAGIGGICVALGLVFICTILYFCDIIDFRGLGEVLFTSGVLFILALIAIFGPVGRINERTGWYVNIEIDGTRVRAERPYHLGAPFVEVSTGEVKKLVDYGKYYYILYGGVNRAIICQKDLLVEGTLEEFENIFAGKIVRKLKKESRKSKTTSAK